MRKGMLALAAGLLSPCAFQSLPSGLFLFAAALLGAVLLFTRLSILALFLLGMAWAGHVAQSALDDRLSPVLDGRTLWLEGEVEGLPARSGDSLRFELVDVRRPGMRLPRRIRVSWFGAPEVNAGERWRLAVKLSRPQGLGNGFGFDYEAWLMARHLGATGSVKDGQRLASAQGSAVWRQRVRDRLLAEPAGGQAAALVALVVGDGSGIDRETWRILRETGTLHLMVISGSHISLLGGLLFALVAGLARIGCWPLRLPWLPCACAVAIAGAWGYGWMAGLEVPALRACLMLSMVLLWRWRFRAMGTGLPLLCALVVALASDPLVSLTPGFWLSFSAVGLLLFGFAGRLGRWSAWQAWPRAQWLMGLGLAPCMLAFGLPLSLSSALANLIAVPLVETLVVPLALAGSLLLEVPWLGSALLSLAGTALGVLLLILGVIADWLPAWTSPAMPFWALLLAGLGVLLWLAPAGLPLRWLGLALCLPALFPASSAPPVGQAEVRVIDVGQGLAVLIRSHSRAWLYDSGPRSGEFDLGELAVLPTLQGLGVKRLEAIVLSHADNDHAGGAGAVLKTLSVGRLISGEPERLALARPAEPCDDQSWEADGLHLSLWHWPNARESNARSCVLLVDAAGERLLLTGDLPEAGERAWLAAHPDVRLDWLVAGHHGSKTSSSEVFLRATQVPVALVSRGHNNPFGHPHPLVMRRFRALGIVVHDTAREGALSVRLGARRAIRGVRESAHFWQEK
ncbi:MAG: ComE operon protein 3 [Pseudomonas delhiensis]|nr:MAG: ComE operon protein 3 [Pseudomonas delhiensis]